MKKWIVLSDMHGRLSFFKEALAKNKDAKLVVIAGDIAPLHSFGIAGLFEQQDWTTCIFVPLLKLYPDKKFIIVPGNHDMYLDESKCSVKDVNAMRKVFHDAGNVQLLIDEFAEVDGYRVYGVPYVSPINGVWAFERTPEQQEELYRKIPFGLDILVSHAPPRFKDMDISLQNSISRQRPFGSEMLYNAIVEKKPKHVFCGHIHSGSHKQYKLNESRVRNVSVLDEDYEETYKPFIMTSKQ